jgi:hypothetical protein
LAHNAQIAIHISLDDIDAWASANNQPELVANIRSNSRRYTQIMADAIDDAVHERWRLMGNQGPPVKDALGEWGKMWT